MTSVDYPRLVGYQVEPHLHSTSEVVGTADFNEESVCHVLTFCAQPNRPIDVGRNEDGDLVWVSLPSPKGNSIPTLIDTPALPITFDPPEISIDPETEFPVGPERFLDSVSRHLSRRGLLVVGSALAGVLLVFVGLGITSNPMNAQSTESVTAPLPTQSPQPSESVLVMEPTEAAIGFVLGGQVSGLVIPDDVTHDSLSATVVSTSGEIVLVEVHAELPEGLTTFATLLLQKSGTAWRIREVFDPR